MWVWMKELFEENVINWVRYRLWGEWDEYWEFTITYLVIEAISEFDDGIRY